MKHLKSANANIKTLLSVTNYKSIKSIQKENPNLNRKEVEEWLLDNYNAIVDTINENELVLKNKEKNEINTRKKANTVYKNKNKKLAKKFLKNFNVEDETVQRIKPTLSETKRFKMASKQFKFENPRNISGFNSLTILNSSIPYLRQAIQEYKGIRVGFAFTFEMERNDTGEKIEFPHISPTQTILNIDNIKNVIVKMLKLMFVILYLNWKPKKVVGSLSELLIYM